MIHARDDYNRMQDPAVNDPSLLGEGCTPIAEDEPVFVIRAQDALAPEVLEHYAAMAHRAGADLGLVNKVIQHANAMRTWQTENGSKRPDLPTPSPDGKEGE